MDLSLNSDSLKRVKRGEKLIELLHFFLICVDMAIVTKEIDGFPDVVLPHHSAPLVIEVS